MARSINNSHVQFLGEGHYTELQRQGEFGDHTLVLCHLTDSNSWDKFEDSEKLLESFTEIIEY